MVCGLESERYCFAVGYKTFGCFWEYAIVKTSSSGSEINAGKPRNVLRDLKDGKIKKR